MPRRKTSRVRPAAPARGVASWLAVVVAATVTVTALAATALAPATIAALGDGPARSPLSNQAAPRLDPRFVALGHSYLPALGRAYAAAWLEGAKELEAGQPVDIALRKVSRSWESGREAAFDRRVAPSFRQIVPEGQADASTAPGRKRALAAAWRGFALGLDPQAR